MTKRITPPKPCPAEPAPAEPSSPYDPDAIFQEDGPLNPSFMREAVRSLMRTMPFDPAEPSAWAHRRMHSAMLALSAMHPRDEIEVMLGVQALAAWQAAAACWRIGMNHHQPSGDSTRHITAAATAARTFDALLRALERRQAKPIEVPVGRPSARPWPEQDPTRFMLDWEDRCRRGEDAIPPESRSVPSSSPFLASPPASPQASPPLSSQALPSALPRASPAFLSQAAPPSPPPTSPSPASPSAQPPPSPNIWTPQALSVATLVLAEARADAQNEGLDIANTEGILPCGGMIMPEHPTPQQEAYMARRLGLAYRRQQADNLRQGIQTLPKIRQIRPGDLIP